MKLYYSPGACSQASHIALYESGLPFQAVLAPTKTKVLPDGSDYRKVNSKGYVPALQLDDGTLITEGPVILQYIADKAAGKSLAPAPTSFERYRLQEWLNYIGTELHKTFGALFDPSTPDTVKDAARTKLRNRFTWVDEQLRGRSYLLGDTYSVADIYLFVVTRWTVPMNVDLSGLPEIEAFMKRMGDRPAVKEALAAEGK